MATLQTIQVAPRPSREWGYHSPPGGSPRLSTRGSQAYAQPLPGAPRRIEPVGDATGQVN